MPINRCYGLASPRCKIRFSHTVIQLGHHRLIAKRQHHAEALDDTWIDFSAYSISQKTSSEKWAMLDVGVHVRNCSARRSTSHC